MSKTQGATILNFHEKFARTHLAFILEHKHRLRNPEVRSFVNSMERANDEGRMAEITSKQYNYLKSIHDLIQQQAWGML